MVMINVMLYFGKFIIGSFHCEVRGEFNLSKTRCCKHESGLGERRAARCVYEENDGVGKDHHDDVCVRSVNKSNCAGSFANFPHKQRKCCYFVTRY